MGQLEFFNRNKKLKTESVKLRKPSAEHLSFADTILEIFGSKVENFGFFRHSTEIEANITKIIFRNENQYLKFLGTTNPRDYPYYFNIILGVGDSENVLDRNWNSIALWRLICKIDSSSTPKEYEFPFKEKVITSISDAAKDLLKYGITFLQGDLTLFSEIISEQNASLET